MIPADIPTTAAARLGSCRVPWDDARDIGGGGRPVNFRPVRKRGGWQAAIYSECYPSSRVRARRRLRKSERPHRHAPRHAASRHATPRHATPLCGTGPIAAALSRAARLRDSPPVRFRFPRRRRRRQRFIINDVESFCSRASLLSMYRHSPRSITFIANPFFFLFSFPLPYLPP